MTNSTPQPEFAVNQVWLDHNGNTKIISSVGKDESECFPIKTLSGLSYTLDGHFECGVIESEYGLKEYIGDYVPKKMENVCRHPDGTLFEVGQMWVYDDTDESNPEAAVILSIREGEIYPIITPDGHFTRNGKKQNDYYNRFNLKYQL